MELNIKDLKHMKNYLIFAGKYLVEQYESETNPDVADLIWEEVDSVSKYINRINNILNSIG